MVLLFNEHLFSEKDDWPGLYLLNTSMFYQLRTKYLSQEATLGRQTEKQRGRCMGDNG
jgi:hypothetical protein